MKILPLTCIIALASAPLLMAEHPTSEHPTKAKSEHPTAKTEKPVLYGVLFYADWCPSCKVLVPKLDEVKPDFKKAGIAFLRLDVTNDETTAAAKEKAEKHGLQEIWEQNEGRTGYMLLVDRKSHEVVGTLTESQSTDELREAMKAALHASSGKPEHPGKSEHPAKSKEPSEKSEHPKKSEETRQSEHPA